jgi:hypothetical protein
MKIALASLALAAALTAGAASAQTSAAPKGALTDACAADIKAYCADAQRGGGALTTCMTKNEAKLSSGCKDAIAKLRRERNVKPGTSRT